MKKNIEVGIHRPVDRPYQLAYRDPETGRPGAEWVGKIVARIGKAADVVVDEGNPRTGAPLKYASMHDLRRTFVMRMDGLVPRELVRQLMRHADSKTTERYYLSTDVQRDAARLRQMLLCAENRTQSEGPIVVS